MFSKSFSSAKTDNLDLRIKLSTFVLMINGSPLFQQTRCSKSSYPTHLSAFNVFSILISRLASKRTNIQIWMRTDLELVLKRIKEVRNDRWIRKSFQNNFAADRDRHDKLQHLVIKSKCSQEGFQAKQSWEKLLSWPSLSYKLTSFVFITTLTWLLLLKLTEGRRF